MAINGPLVTLDLAGRIGTTIGPTGAKVEKRLLYDIANIPIEIVCGVFDYDEAIGVPDPHIIWSLPLPYAYAEGAGLSLALVYALETVGSGAVVWEISACVARMSQAGETFGALSWGTPAVATADTVPSIAGQFKGITIGVEEASFGFAGSSTTNGDTAQMLFVRLRRKNTSALDTLRAPVLLFGAELLEGVP
jgi:hypothetical protein